MTLLNFQREKPAEKMYFNNSNLPSCSLVLVVQIKSKDNKAHFFFFIVKLLRRTLRPLDSLISQACSVQSNGSLCQASVLPGSKTRGRRPSVSYQEAQCQRTGSKLAFLWAWVGAIGQESFYTWSLSQSQFGERLFLSLKG